MKKALLLILITGCFALYSAADSLKIAWGMVHDTGEEFTVDELSNMSFKAWISNSGVEYISNVVTDTLPGNSIENFYDLRGSCIIDFKNFPDWQWRTGDKLNLLVKNYNWFKDESYYEAFGDWYIPENADGLYLLGFEDYIGTGGFPINTWTPCEVITDVYINCVDNSGNKFDFNTYPFDNVSFKCWVTGRESEIIDQNSSGSAFVDITTSSFIKIYRYDFETGWENGDTLNVSIRQWIPGQGFYTGDKKFVFTTTHSFSHYGPFDIHFGFEEFEGDDPVSADIWNENTGVEGSEAVPLATALYQNYPNPFNPVTQIKFALAKTSDVKLRIHNVNGQKVAELVNGVINAGFHTVDFDGSKLNSGVYYYTLDVDGIKLTQKMILMK